MDGCSFNIKQIKIYNPYPINVISFWLNYANSSCTSLFSHFIIIYQNQIPLFFKIFKLFWCKDWWEKNLEYMFELNLFGLLCGCKSKRKSSQIFIWNSITKFIRYWPGKCLILKLKYQLWKVLLDKCPLLLLKLQKVAKIVYGISLLSAIVRLNRVRSNFLAHSLAKSFLIVFGFWFS